MVRPVALSNGSVSVMVWWREGSDEVVTRGDEEVMLW